MTKRPIIYLDCETDNTNDLGLDIFRTKVVTVQFMDEKGRVTILKDPTSLDKLKKLLENCLVVGHNIGFDSRLLKYHYGVTLYHVYDTQIAEVLISGGLFAGKRGVTGLKDVVLRRFGVEMDKHEQTGFQWGVPLTEEQKQYAANDLKYLPLIYAEQQKDIRRLGLEEVTDIEMSALPGMVWLYLSGISYDADKLEKLKVDLLCKKMNAETTLYKAFGTSRVNFASPIQLKKALAGVGIDVENASVDSIKAARIRMSKCGVTGVKRPRQTTLFGAEDEEIDPVDILDNISNYKEASKLLNTFVGKLPTYVNKKTGRVHADYRQLGAKSGRMSCSNPNMQQQPSKRLKGWREIFAAEPGWKIVIADYSQAELRILTELSGDEYFTNAYLHGIDMHKMTASKIYHKEIDDVTDKERSICKTVNFGLTYGMGAGALQRRLKTDSGIEITDDEAESTVKGFYYAYPGVAEYLKEIENQGLRELKVRTKAGRLMKFEFPKDEAEEGMIRRLAKNLPIQGLCADIVKKAIGQVFLRLEPMGVKFLAVVHDEIVLSCKEEIAEEVKEILEEEMKKAAEPYITTVPFYAEGTIADYWKH